MIFYIENDVVLRGFESEDGNVDTVVEIPEGISEINILDEDGCLSEECKCLTEGVEVIIIPGSVKRIDCFSFFNNEGDPISSLKEVYYNGTLS